MQPPFVPQKNLFRKQEEVAKKLRKSPLIFQLSFCRIWHHTLPLFSVQLVVEVSKGLSLHLSG
jgi:hypothetical protein